MVLYGIRYLINVGNFASGKELDFLKLCLKNVLPVSAQKLLRSQRLDYLFVSSVISFLI